MKVLHILSSDDRYGSALCFTELLNIECSNRNIEPIVVTPRKNRINTLCDELGINNYSVMYEQFQIPKHNSALIFIVKYLLHFLVYYIRNPLAVFRVEKIAKSNSVDIIHTNSCVIDIGAIISRKCKLPHVWHIREFGKEDYNFYSTRPNYIKFMNRNATNFIVVSETVKEAWNKKGLDNSKMKVLYDGVVASRFDIRKKKVSEEKIRIVMTGSFSRTKGQLFLVEALMLIRTQLNNVQIDFFGRTEGEYYKTVRNKVKEYNLDGIVSFKGYSENISSELMNYDIGIICSKSEAFGRVTVEYMLAGLCPIAPNSGANTELLMNENCGILFEAGNPQSLADVLSQLINDRERVLSIGKIASEVASEKYDIAINADKILECFSDSCSR